MGLSAKNNNTEGCKPQRDMQAMTIDGKAKDLEVHALEQLVLQGDVFDGAQLRHASELVADLTKFLKTGNQKASGLKFLMKMDAT